MSNELKEALQAYAEEAPAFDASPARSERTWRRARRVKTLTNAGAALAVVAIVAGALFTSGLVVLSRSAPTVSQPYDPAKLALPETVWRPSPWTASTSDDGPIGPLALIATAPHRTSWFHIQQDTPYGVSAATGTYRFIDLPDRDTNAYDQADIALSPDGTQIGYWLSGNLTSPGAQSDVIGYAAYDTVTGRTTKHLVPTSFGLSPRWLVWTADSHSLVAGFGEYENGSTRDGAGTSDFAPAQLWTPSSRRTLILPRFLGVDQAPESSQEGLTYFSGLHSVMVLDPFTGRVSRSRIDADGYGAPILSPDGTLMAIVGNRRDSYLGNGMGGVAAQHVSVAERTTPGSSPWQSHPLVLNSPKSEVFGWIDNTHLLVGLWTSTRFQELARERVSSIDIVSGQAITRMKLVGRLNEQPFPSLATDLISRPFVAGGEPDAPLDPRVVPSVFGGILLFAVFVWAIWALGWRIPKPKSDERA